jgi:hypothetical protein
MAAGHGERQVLELARSCGVAIVGMFPGHSTHRRCLPFATQSNIKVLTLLRSFLHCQLRALRSSG